MNKDKKVHELIQKEEARQKKGIELIPSENYASKQVRDALSSYFVNKYSEGYPKRRYYGGNEFVDDIELLAQERAKKLFGVPFVNVQPYSGSPANFAVMMAVCKPGDTLMGQALTAGGHLTHGHKVSASGIFFKSVQYSLKSNEDENFAASQLSDPERSRGGVDLAKKFSSSDNDDLFDYDEILRLAKKHEPSLIWVGATAYPLKFKYNKFAKIADEVGAYMVADIAHVSGLIAGGSHPSPVPYAHIITTTTHKTLRGPRGAMIMVTEKGLKKDAELPDKINKAVFPGLQGGPHDNTTAALAIALYEALQPEFKKYAAQIVSNSQALAESLMQKGLKLVGNGSENHLILVDLSQTHSPGFGTLAEKALDLAGLTLNKNTVPNEPMSPFYPSGIRLGTPAATTRSMKEKDMKFIARVICEVLDEIKGYSLPEKREERQSYIKNFKKQIAKNKKIASLEKEVNNFASAFPIP